MIVVLFLVWVLEELVLGRLELAGEKIWRGFCVDVSGVIC